MMFVLALLIALQAGAILIGVVLERRVILPMPRTGTRHLMRALVHAGLYTPTFAAGGHGVAILPGALSLVFTEHHYLPYAMALPGLVFAISLLVSFLSSPATRDGAAADAENQQQPVQTDVPPDPPAQSGTGDS